MAGARDPPRSGAERPDHPEVVRRCCDGARPSTWRRLYAPEAQPHPRRAAALLAPEVDFLAAWRVGPGGRLRRGRGACRASQPRAASPTARSSACSSMPCAARPAASPRSCSRRWKPACAARASARRCSRPARDQREAVRLYERCGYARRGAFGGYPDNGLSLFMRQAHRDMKLDDDDFTLFGLPQRFALDRAALDARWRALQAAGASRPLRGRGRAPRSAWRCSGRCASTRPTSA